MDKTITCTIFKIKVDKAYYHCTVCGNTTLAKEFMANQWKAEEITFVRTTTRDLDKVGYTARRNKIVSDKFLLVELEYLSEWRGITTKQQYSNLQCLNRLREEEANHG